MSKVDLEGLYVNGELHHFDSKLQSEPVKMKKDNIIEIEWSTLSDFMPDEMILMRLYFKTEKGKYLLGIINSKETWPTQKDEIHKVTTSLSFLTAEKMDGVISTKTDPI